MSRLTAMQLQIMGFGATSPTLRQPARRVPRFDEAAALRSALAFERRARQEAEARLRAVLDEVGRQSVKAARAAPVRMFRSSQERPTAPLPALPAAQPAMPSLDVETAPATSPMLDVMRSALMEGEHEDIDGEFEEA